MDEISETTMPGTEIEARLAKVKSLIDSAGTAAGRPPKSVTLVAISKAHPQEKARAALVAGHRIFGENRVQEATAKWPQLRQEFSDLELHLVGPLQTNKVRDVMALFDVIQTVDRTNLARALAKEMDRSGRRPACFIEVNTGEEPQKAGVLPQDADAFIAACRNEYRLPVVGLMCIPPQDEVPAMHFALLAEIAGRNGLDGLSMGMSADYEVAVRFGATHVRVGTAIFGERLPQGDPTAG